MTDNAQVKRESLGSGDRVIPDEMPGLLPAEQAGNRADRAIDKASEIRRETHSPVKSNKQFKNGLGGRNIEVFRASSDTWAIKPALAKSGLGNLSDGTARPEHREHREQNSGVVLERAYGTRAEYGRAVFDQINRVLRKHGYQTTQKTLRNGVWTTEFSTRMQGMTVKGRVLCESALLSNRIEFVVCKDILLVRLPLIEHLMQRINADLRYGDFIAERQTGEIRLVYSSCYRRTFASNAFDCYLGALLMTCREYCKPLSEIAKNEELSDEAQNELRQLIRWSAAGLPAEATPC